MSHSKKISLFHYEACTFCAVTRSVISGMKLDIEHLDIVKNNQYREALIKGGGKKQVPCLKIQEHGNVKWLYESSDIIAYLKNEFSGVRQTSAF